MRLHFLADKGNCEEVIEFCKTFDLATCDFLIKNLVLYNNQQVCSAEDNQQVPGLPAVGRGHPSVTLNCCRHKFRWHEDWQHDKQQGRESSQVRHSVIWICLDRNNNNNNNKNIRLDYSGFPLAVTGNVNEITGCFFCRELWSVGFQMWTGSL